MRDHQLKRKTVIFMANTAVDDGNTDLMVSADVFCGIVVVPSVRSVSGKAAGMSAVRAG